MLLGGDIMVSRKYRNSISLASSAKNKSLFGRIINQSTNRAERAYGLTYLTVALIKEKKHRNIVNRLANIARHHAIDEYNTLALLNAWMKLYKCMEKNV